MKNTRIDQVSDKRIRNIKDVRIIDKRTIAINIHNQAAPIILEAQPEEYGYSARIYMQK